jgi:hypothetical protein
MTRVVGVGSLMEDWQQIDLHLGGLLLARMRSGSSSYIPALDI